MRLLYIYQYFGTPRGGWSTRVYEMARRWTAQGHHVTVLTSPYDKSDFKAGNRLIEKYTIEGIHVIVINIAQSNKHSKLYRMLTFSLFSLLSIYFALKLKYDLVIASSGPITVGIPALVAKIFRGRKMVFEVRDLWPGGAVSMGIIRNKNLINLFYFLERTFYNHSAFVACASVGMAENIKKRYEDLRIEVVPNASDVELFSGPGEAGFQYPEWAVGVPLFIYFGSLGLMDNCGQIIKAAIELKRRGREDIRIVFIGEGAERPALMKEAEENHLDNVFFTGLVPKVQVVSWLKHCTATMVVFQPNDILDTSSPNKLFDSLAAAKPVIQTTQGWIKKLVEEENIGITVSPNAAIEMADAIEKLSEDSDLREEMSKNSLRLAQTLFNRDFISADYLNLLKEQVQVE